MRPLNYLTVLFFLIITSGTTTAQCHIEILNNDPLEICPGDSVHLIAQGECAGMGNVAWSHGVSSLDGGWVSPSSTTTYTVYILDTTGESAHDDILIKVLPAPDVNITGNDTMSYFGGYTILDAGSGFESYLWSTGAATQTLFIDSALVHLGLNTFSVTVANNYGCTNSDVFDVYAENTTSAGQEKTPLNIKLYPNPAKDELFIDMNNNLKNPVVEIYSSSGQCLFSKAFTAPVFPGKIDLSYLKAGVYIIKINNDSTVATRKLIIK
ncbi:MAG: T9SS type A sorting domain-containing protein [Bacteroidales bacterium]|nr:T9SS type A sorting domain-containing protein [Bacteroidales bacterium]